MGISTCLNGFGLLMIAGFGLSGCATGDGEVRGSAPALSLAEQADGQVTSVTAEGQIQHEEDCAAVAEKNRIQPPSVELGLNRQIPGNSLTTPYTRFNCR